VVVVVVVVVVVKRRLPGQRTGAVGGRGCVLGEDGGPGSAHVATTVDVDT